MELHRKACFVKRPRVIGDLMSPYLIVKERQFQIVKTIKLTRIDYENFISDMLADRQFIEDHAELCGKEKTWKCLLIQQYGRMDGVLVIPMEKRYVGWAAYYHERINTVHPTE
jgi:hypothetical protein